MEFKRTNVERLRCGFTLPELLVSLALSGLVLAGAASFFVFSNRSFVAIANYTDLNDQSRNASDVLSRDIRSATRVVSFTTNQIVFKAADGVNVTYTCDPSTRTLNRVKGSAARTLLTEVDSLTFSLYQRPATNAVYNQFPAATAANAKLVAFQWSCSRTITGVKLNSEIVQTAMVDLRNR